MPLADFTARRTASAVYAVVVCLIRKMSSLSSYDAKNVTWQCLSFSL